MPDKHQHPFCFGNIEGSTVLLVTKVESVSCSVHYLNGKGHLLKLADDLQTYLRLMLLYLGLPDWPLLHLKIEPSYWVKVSHPSTRNNSAALIVWRLPPESCTHLPARGQGRRRQWSNSASDLRMTYMRGRSVRFPPIMIGINIEINRRIQWRCLVAQGQPRNKNKRNQTSVIPSFSVRSEVFFFPTDEWAINHWLCHWISNSKYTTISHLIWWSPPLRPWFGGILKSPSTATCSKTRPRTTRFSGNTHVWPPASISLIHSTNYRNTPISIPRILWLSYANHQLCQICCDICNDLSGGITDYARLLWAIIIASRMLDSIWFRVDGRVYADNMI